MTPALPLLILLSTTAPTGEVVRAIRIDAGPAQEERRLMPYVTLRLGDTLDPEEVRRSVRLLFATGEFADVLVETQRTPTGVEVVFRPLRAPRLSSIVVEGDALLTPAEIRRATRLRDGELLLPRRLERAAQDAALALADSGYLEARVSATTGPSPAEARAVFRIQSGPMTRIAAARVTGLDALQTRNAVARLQSQPMRPFSRKRAQSDARKLRQRLRKAGYLSATVDLRELYDPLQSRILLAFEVQTGPPTTVVFRGLEPATQLRQRARRLLDEAGLRPDALEEVVELIEDELRRRGFPLASVTHEQRDERDVRRVVFAAKPGPLVRVSAVRVEGAPSADMVRLVTTRVGQRFREQQVERDALALRRALEEQGYPSTQVDYETPIHTGAAAVVFRVRAGTRTTVAAVQVVAPVPLSGATPEDLDVKAGDAYSVGAVARARTALTTAYQNAGYAQVNVLVDSEGTSEPGAVRLVFRVDPGERAVIERILVSGLRNTREEVVRRELLIHEGDPLRWDLVLDSHRRLSALGLFRAVSIYELDPDESRRRSLVVAVEEGPRTSLTGGIGAAGVRAELGAGSRSSDVNPVLRLSLEVARRNLGGLDRDLSLFTRLSFRGSRFLATYHEPYLLGHRTDMSMTVFREEEERKTFNFDRVGVSLQNTRKLAPRWNLMLRYVFSRTRVSDLAVPESEVDREYRNELSSGPSFSLVNDTRDDPLDPRRGHFLSVDSQLSHAVLGGDSFSKSFVHGSLFQPLGGRFLLAMDLRLGAAWTFGLEELDVPIGAPPESRRRRLGAPDRFYAGGSYSMRGFDTDAVAPEGGLALGVGSLELRCALGRSLSLAAFTDFGGVGSVYPTDAEAQARCQNDPDACYPKAPRFSHHDLRVSVGVGLRYRTPVGPIRFDWGFKLDPRTGEPRSRPHITVGHAF